MANSLINISEVWQTVTSRGDSIVVAPRAISDDSQYTSPLFNLTIRCSQGHTRISQVNNCNISCKVCKFITSNITYNHTYWMINQSWFDFTCSRGHKFGLNTLLNTNCKGCELAGKLPPHISMDVQRTYRDEYSILRLHCNKCSSDFYSTPKELLEATEYCHKSSNSIIAKVITAAESVSGDRFDHEVYNGINRLFVTAYNADLKIAIIHLHDLSSHNMLNQIVQWCDNNEISLIIIDKHIEHRDIVRELQEYGFGEENELENNCVYALTDNTSGIVIDGTADNSARVHTKSHTSIISKLNTDGSHIKLNKKNIVGTA